jgi:hypothetical protein
MLFGLQSVVYGQASPSVKATVSETTLFTGERLKLDVTINGDFNKVERPNLPQFPGFQLLSSNPSTSRSISYVNGVSKSSYTYSYYLSPQDVGTHQIPPVTIKVDDIQFRTQPVEVRVVDRQDAANNTTGKDQPDIFLRLNVSDQQPITGEQIIANVVLFFKEGLEVRSYQPIPGWKAEGFWKEELESGERPQVESTIINGIRYRSARLLQFALFPTKSGKLTISPYEVRVSVRSASQRDDPFSSFFGGFGSNQRDVELETEPISLTVDTLPTYNGASYIGAVGSYEINRKVNTTDATAGESIEIETTVNGTGNVPLINKPEYDYPDGFEVYQPQENTTINRKNQRISGRKTYTDVVIARAAGTFTIPEANLAYYDPGRSEYVTEVMPAKTITVKPNPNSETGIGQPQSLSLQPITGLASWITQSTEDPADYWWFWAGLILPAAVFVLAYWQKTYREKMNTDRSFARSQEATAKAQERLDDALQHSEEGRIGEAYNALQKALTGFIGDRLGMPEAGLSIEQYITALEEKAVNEDLVENVRMLLNKCATINYAPEGLEDYLKSHVGLAESIIKKLKKEL